MTLNLERGDLLQIEPISHTGTLRLLPIGRKNKQKLVVGDDSGQLHCYEFKRGEPQIVFQVKVFDGPISSIALGGSAQKRDKIFLSHSQRIVGVTKKGKEFFKLTSSLTEAIENIWVEDTRIWTGCEYIYNLFDNGADTAYYISKDLINDLLVAKVTRDNDFDTCLACQDSCIRIIQGSNLFLEVPTESPVTALGFMEIEGDVAPVKGPTGLVYGTATGILGFYQIFSNGEVTPIWIIEDDVARCPITCLCIYDLVKDGRMEIIVGRDDGRVEVFKQQPESIFGVPTKVFSKDIGESVRSLECGMVGTPDFNEILVASYSGKIISFTTEPVHNRATEDTYGRSIQTVNNENRIKHMQKELDELRRKIDRERERVKKATAAGSGGSKTLTDEQMQQQCAPDFPINTKFLLDSRVAAYMLTIELQTPIDLIILRSPVVLELVETDTGTSVLSVTPPHMLQMAASSSSGTGSGGGGSGSADESDGKFVAVFRCQAQEKRITLNLRTNEGEYGDLVVTIVADSNPKAAKIVKYDLKPLSLNQKVYELTQEELARPKNRLRYTGSVQLSVLHEWVHSIFPDVPPRMDESAVDQEYHFRNTFTGAVTSVEYKKNEITFESESASTIAIVKENVVRLANYRRTALEEFVTAEDASISAFLNLIRPKLEHQLSLSRKMQLVDSVQELAMADAAPADGGSQPSLEWMTEEYRDILRNQESIRQDFKKRDKSLEFLSGIVTDLYVDWCKLQGSDGKARIPKLSEVIQSGDFDEIVRYFPAVASRK